MNENKISGVYILLTPVAYGMGYEYRIAPLTEEEVNSLYDSKHGSAITDVGVPDAIYKCYNNSKVVQDIAEARKEGMTLLNALFLANGEYPEHGVMIIEFPYAFEYYKIKGE